MNENKMNLNNEYKSYLGKIGYTLFKEDINEKILEQIKKLLTVKPFVNINITGIPAVSYPVYRESGTKIYIPKYFGIYHFGIYKKSKIPKGEDINIQFNGSLREIQINVIETYLDNIKQQEKNGLNGGGGLIELQTGQGKTVIGLNIISKLKKKTLIIVHKEFLANQWIERIEQFLPESKIGRIQGTTIDIENKDIVIGMLQSLSMKKYPDDIFESFGLLIVDEVHHISSEVFSQCLFKIVTKYTLGLSATMNRKDGTSYIFKYFLGDVIYKNKDKEHHNVVIRKIKYISNEEEFNHLKLDSRGNPQYSTMIVKLSNFNPRSDFILKIVKDMIIENSKQQIMILAHNRNLIDYLFNKIELDNISTVGKYVGGMKQEHLKETETKQIILGTYSMASEGLDIKTLTTLILATPKSDVVQSVGRILRVKDNNPIVVDIVDIHSIFENQYFKRETFYKQNNYKIISCNNINYSCEISKWKILFEPLIKEPLNDATLLSYGEKNERNINENERNINERSINERSINERSINERNINERSIEDFNKITKYNKSIIGKRKNKIETLLSQKKFFGNYKFNKNNIQEITFNK